MSVRIRLSSLMFQVTEIVKPTSAKFFHALIPGDKFKISTELVRMNRVNGRMNAVNYTIVNMRTKQSRTLAQNEIINRLENFKFEVVYE